MQAVFSQSDKGAKLTIVGIYIALAANTGLFIYEFLQSCWFRFSIAGVLSPTDIPWFNVLPASMQNQTYMFSIYWIYIYALGLLRPIYYGFGSILLVAGMRSPYMYPLAVGGLVICWIGDVVRWGYVFIGYFDCKNTFLCRLQTSPYNVPDDTLGTNKNPFYVWWMWLMGSQLVSSFVLIVLMLLLKYAVTLLTPAEEEAFRNGTATTGDEGDVDGSKAIRSKKSTSTKKTKTSVKQTIVEPPKGPPKYRIGNPWFFEFEQVPHPIPRRRKTPTKKN
jgi:hypothetical protein